MCPAQCVKYVPGLDRLQAAPAQEPLPGEIWLAFSTPTPGLFSLLPLQPVRKCLACSEYSGSKPVYPGI
jgi:hypothetical protein